MKKIILSCRFAPAIPISLLNCVRLSTRACKSFVLVFVFGFGLLAQQSSYAQTQKLRPVEDVAYSCEGTGKAELSKHYDRIYLSDGTFYEEFNGLQSGGRSVGKWKHAPRGDTPWIEYENVFFDDKQRWSQFDLLATYNAKSGKGVRVMMRRLAAAPGLEWDTPPEQILYCEENTAEQSQVLAAKARRSAENLASATTRSKERQLAQLHTSAEADQMQLLAIQAVVRAAQSNNPQCRINSKIVETSIHKTANSEADKTDIFVRRGLKPNPHIAEGSYMQYKNLVSMLTGC